MTCPLLKEALEVEINFGLRVGSEELLREIDHIPEIGPLHVRAVAADHDEPSGHLHHIALGVLLHALARAVLTQELKVGLPIGPRPLVRVPAVRVGLHARVAHERHVALALGQAAERARVTEEVLAL